MAGGRTGLPPCTEELFDDRQSFAALTARGGADWRDTVMEAIQGNPVLREVNRQEFQYSVLEIPPGKAMELAGLIAAGSLLHGPCESLRAPDTERDACLRELLRSVGDGARFFTNHGHAEDGAEGDFLASSFHADVLAGTTIDVCLVGVSDENVLVLWRFEED